MNEKLGTLCRDAFKVAGRIDKFFLKKNASLLFLAFSVLVPLVVVALPQYEIDKRSFSSVGYENPVWFLFWGVSTALASVYGFRTIANNCAPDNSFAKASLKPLIKRYFFLLNCIASVCVVVLTVVYEKDQNSIANVVHLVAAQLFGVFFVASVCGLFCLSIKDFGHNALFVVVIVVTAMASFVAIIVFDKMTAQRQFLGMLPTMFVMMSSIALGKTKFGFVKKMSDELGVGA